jgi:hypothetical protein
MAGAIRSGRACLDFNAARHVVVLHDSSCPSLMPLPRHVHQDLDLRRLCSDAPRPTPHTPTLHPHPTPSPYTLTLHPTPHPQALHTELTHHCHQDFEAGFICAEVMAFDDLKEYGTVNPKP